MNIPTTQSTTVNQRLAELRGVVWHHGRSLNIKGVKKVDAPIEDNELLAKNGIFCYQVLRLRATSDMAPAAREPVSGLVNFLMGSLT